VRVSRQALLCRGAPVLEREGAGYRDLEAALGGQLGELAENVVALLSAVLEVEADAQLLGFGEVAEGQYAVR